MNTYRLMLADAIENNGGYYADRWARYAIEYNVGLYHVDLSKEHMYELAVKHGLTDRPYVEIEWNEDSEFEWAQQNAARGIMDGDDCCYNSYDVPTSIRFGLPYFTKRRYAKRTNECAYYPAKVSGWMIKDQYANVEFEVEMGLYGRGGKHLCVSKFEGIKLDMSSADLAEAIRDTEEDQGYSNKWCHKLLAMMHVWEEMFTPEKASTEVEYQAAHSYSILLEEKYEELEKEAKQAADIELAYRGV